MITEEDQKTGTKSNVILEQLNSLKQEDETLYNIVTFSPVKLAR